MSDNNENIMIDELNDANLTLRNDTVETWRLETTCNLKLISIEHFENSTEKTKIENEGLNKQLHDVNSQMDKVRDNIISLDRIINSLEETLVDLEVQNKKKEFSVHQSKNNLELQLFIKKEQWQMNEEYINNIPEVKCMKMVESELKTIQLEYDNLFVNNENLVGTIAKAKIKNDEKMNGNMIKLAEIYNEMLSVTEREKQSITLLRKLEAEYNDKLNVKSALLSRHKKPDKISFWPHISMCPINLKKDTNNEEFKGNESFEETKDILNPNFDHLRHENVSYLELDNKHMKSIEPKKSVNFCLPSNELHGNIQITNDDCLNNFNNENTNTEILESNIQNSEILPNYLFVKNNSDVNESNYKSSKNLTTEQKTMNSDSVKRQINKEEQDFLTKKAKTFKNQSNIELKKQNDSILDENNSDQNINHVESNLRKNLEKIDKPASEMSINHHIDTYAESSSNHNLPKLGYLQFVEQNLKNNSSNKTHKTLQPKKKSLHEQSNVLSELFWSGIGDQRSECSSDESFCNFDMGDYFDDNNMSQSSNLQLSFMNAHNSDPNSMSGYSFQETNLKNGKVENLGNGQQFNK